MMMSLPVSPKYSVGPLILALCAIVAFFLEPLSGEWLAYDRFALQGLETWRLLSGNIDQWVSPAAEFIRPYLTMGVTRRTLPNRSVLKSFRMVQLRHQCRALPFF